MERGRHAGEPGAPPGLGGPLLSPRRSARAVRRRCAPHRSLFAVALSIPLLSCATAPPGERPPPAPPEDSDETSGFGLELVGVIGAYGTGVGQLAFPKGVAVDALGRIFVADTGNHRVVRFDPAGVYLGEFGGLGFEPGRFDRPRDLFIGERLNLWVLDGENLRVVKYDLEGRLVGVALDLRDREVELGLGRVRPGGLAGDPGGLLYLTDTVGDRLLAFEPLGAEVRIVGGYGTQPARFRTPTGVAVDERGTVLVADNGNARVQALDAFGGFLRAWPLVEAHDERPVAVAWLPDGGIAVLESEASRLTLWDAEGRVTARRVERGDQPGELSRPRALAVDRSGRIYVADTDNHRIQVFRRTGTRPSSSG